MDSNILKSIEDSQLKKRPDVQVGDTVKLHLKIKEGEKERIQIFEGVVISIKGSGLNKNIVVRKISYGVGVEKIVTLHSPVLEKVEVVKRGTVRRSKLYYLRDRVGRRALKAGESKDIYLTDEEEVIVPEVGEAEVPEEGRYVVVSPRFMELLARTDSKLLSTDYNQGEGGLKNGLVMNGKLRGFSIYKTNNAPKHTAGAGDLIIAGHMSAVATVSSIDKVEKIRSETSFADIVRGLHVYGRGIVRPESLAVAAVDYA